MWTNAMRKAICRLHYTRIGYIASFTRLNYATCNWRATIFARTIPFISSIVRAFAKFRYLWWLGIICLLYSSFVSRLSKPDVSSILIRIGHTKKMKCMLWFIKINVLLQKKTHEMVRFCLQTNPFTSSVRNTRFAFTHLFKRSASASRTWRRWHL